MKLLDMKLRVTNAVRAYFNRNWTREDLMNFGEIPEIAYTGLKRVYSFLWFHFFFIFDHKCHERCKSLLRKELDKRRPDEYWRNDPARLCKLEEGTFMLTDSFILYI
ncbi:hypothetical protein RDI58_002089 [Solanum bulbocastanum]|uniref:Uncharacterized protein n=1 Tax=Solanum bulbocastanum TaxID=147425 RepID=A0AAN8UCV4_SOLBU